MSGPKPGLSFEAEELAYYAEYGRALAAWTDVEAVLGYVANVFFEEGMPRNMVNLGVTGIQGFHSKLQFVNLVVIRGLAGITVVNQRGTRVGDGRALFQAAWKALVDRADTLSGQRNHLAHYVTSKFPESPKEGRRIALCPWRGPKGTPKDKPPKGSYTVKKLICTRRSFERLSFDLVNFVNRLCKNPEQPALSGKPEDDLPTTQQIADEMHEALGHARVSAKEKRRRESEANALSSLETEIHVKPAETLQPESRGRAEENAQHSPIADSAKAGGAKNNSKK
jgi:hypothetical protein